MEYRIVELTSNGSKNRGICLGYFDGMHLGHQKIIKKCLKKCRHKNYRCTLLTFSTNPKGEEKNLISLERKMELAKSYGIDEIVILQFNQETKNITPAQFLDFLANELGVKEVFVGRDFGFGKDRQGDVITLKESKLFKTNIIRTAKFHGIVASTSLIKKLIEEGKLTLANRLLNHNYVIMSTVIKEEVGTTNEYPKIYSLSVEKNTIIPGPNNYFSIIHFDDTYIFGYCVIEKGANNALIFKSTLDCENILGKKVELLVMPRIKVKYK